MNRIGKLPKHDCFRCGKRTSTAYRCVRPITKEEEFFFGELIRRWYCHECHVERIKNAQCDSRSY